MIILYIEIEQLYHRIDNLLPFAIAESAILG